MVTVANDYGGASQVGLFLSLLLSLSVLLTVVVYCFLLPKLRVQTQSFDTFASENLVAREAAKGNLRVTLLFFFGTLYGFLAVSFFGLLAANQWEPSVTQDDAEFWFFMCWGASTPVAYLAGRFGPALCGKLFEYGLGRGSYFQDETETIDRAFLQFSFNWRLHLPSSVTAYLLPSLCAFVAYTITILTCVCAVNWSFFSEVVVQRLALENFPVFVQLLMYTLYTMLIAPFWDLTCPTKSDIGAKTGGGYLGTPWLALVILEEVAWSGMLFPILRRWFDGPRSFLWSWLVTSAVWVSWHTPFILFNAALPEDMGYVPGADSTPLVWGLTGFALDLSLARLIMCILSEANASAVLPCSLFHASHNMLIESFCVQMMAPNPGDSDGTSVYVWFVGESSVFQVAVYAVVAYFVCRLFHMT